VSDHEIDNDAPEATRFDAALRTVDAVAAHQERRRDLLGSRNVVVTSAGVALVVFLVLWSAWAPWPQSAFLSSLGFHGVPVKTVGIGTVLANWRLLAVIVVAFVAYFLAMHGTLWMTLRSPDADHKLASALWRRRQIATAVLAALAVAGAVVAAQFYRAVDAGNALRHHPGVTQSDVDRLTGGTGAWIQVAPSIVYWQGDQPEHRGPVLVVDDFDYRKVYVLDPKDGTHLTVSSEGYGVGGG
jgi:hypothetical protein